MNMFWCSLSQILVLPLLCQTTFGKLSLAMLCYHTPRPPGFCFCVCTSTARLQCLFLGVPTLITYIQIGMCFLVHRKHHCSRCSWFASLLYLIHPINTHEYPFRPECSVHLSIYIRKVEVQNSCSISIRTLCWIAATLLRHLEHLKLSVLGGLMCTNKLQLMSAPQNPQNSSSPFWFYWESIRICDSEHM